MANRTGKREREARNRPKRGFTFGYVPDGARLTALMLCRKKRLAFSRSTRFVGFKCFGFSLQLVMAAVPVAEAERQGQTVVERGS